MHASEALRLAAIYGNRDELGCELGLGANLAIQANQNPNQGGSGFQDDEGVEESGSEQGDENRQGVELPDA